MRTIVVALAVALVTASSSTAAFVVTSKTIKAFDAAPRLQSAPPHA